MPHLEEVAAHPRGGTSSPLFRPMPRAPSGLARCVALPAPRVRTACSQVQKQDVPAYIIIVLLCEHEIGLAQHVVIWDHAAVVRLTLNSEGHLLHGLRASCRVWLPLMTFCVTVLTCTVSHAGAPRD